MIYRHLFALTALVFFVGTVVPAQHRGKKADSAHNDSSTVSVVYTCPMHPKVTSSTAGACPDCGMDLVRQKDKTAPKKANDAKMKKEASSTGTNLYTCPMHPKVTSSTPGKCPDCGMALVQQTAKPAAAKKAGHSKMKKHISKCDDCAECENCTNHEGHSEGHSKSTSPDSTKYH